MSKKGTREVVWIYAGIGMLRITLRRTQGGNAMENLGGKILSM